MSDAEDYKGPQYVLYVFTNSFHVIIMSYLNAYRGLNV